MSTRSSSASSPSLTAEPAAAPAEIQPAGFLLVLGQDWRIRHVSENIGDHFAHVGRSMAGQPLAEYFGAAAVHALRNQLALLRDPQGTARLFSLFFAGVPKAFDAAMHEAGGNIVFEAFPAAHLEAGDPVGTVRELAARLDGRDLPTLLDQGAHQLRALTGFDRVALFRSIGDGGLELAAQDSRGDHSPASPPRQVPDRPRLICDGKASGVEIDPPAEPIMLARSILRSPDEAERDELRANDAMASLTLPIAYGQQMWGVALCLNHTARRPMLDRLGAAELFADLLAMRIEICELRSR
jgi:light-regulated signal transduction histidine kinase (bacteriophytochrome)